MTTEKDNIERRLQSWIQSFLDYTENLVTPEPMRKWAARSCVAAALERRCFLTTTQGALYPSLYTLLAGTPGCGKSKIIREVQSLWHSTDVLKLASNSVTKASLVDELAEHGSRIITDTTGIKLDFHSLQVCSTEFSVLVPAYDSAFMNFLNILFDCEDYYKESRRALKEDIYISQPQLNILAGTQPAYLGQLLTVNDFNMGFPSRLIMIYAEAAELKPMFELGDETKLDLKLKEDLQADLKAICALMGEFEFDRETKQVFNNWYLSHKINEPTHPKLKGYCERRPALLLKLMMGESVSCTTDLNITVEHFETCLADMLAMEQSLPRIFEQMISSDDSAIVDETLAFMSSLYKKTNNPIPEHKIINFIAGKAPINKVKFFLDTMVNAGRIGIAEKTDINGVVIPQPYKHYLPTKL